MHKLARLPAIVCALLASVPAPAQTPPLLAGMATGPHDVGFSVVRTADPSRPFGPAAAPVPRPIQISLWYPTAPGHDARRMLFRHYAGHVATEGKPRPLTDEAAREGIGEYVAYHESIGAPPEALAALMETPMLAAYDAPVAAGRHPVVLFAVGKDESPVQHAVLAEYLASHGYLVASVPTMGARTREMTFDQPSVEAHARDLAFLLAYLRRHPSADAGRTGALGYSFGAGAALILAMRDPGVRAVASLDGSVGFRDRTALFEASPLFRPGRMRAPFLHLNARGLERNDPRLIDALVCAPRTVASLDGAEHLDFGSLGAIAGAFPDFRGPDWRFPRAPDPARTHATAARYVLAFFDAHLRGAPEARRLLESPPESVGLAPGAVEIRRAAPAPSRCRAGGRGA